MKRTLLKIVKSTILFSMTVLLFASCGGDSPAEPSVATVDPPKPTEPVVEEMHYPKTNAEIKDAITLNENISKELKTIVEEERKKSGSVTASSILASVSKIEGVISAVPNASGSCITIMHKDSVITHLYLNDEVALIPLSQSRSSITTKSVETVNGGQAIVSNGEKALIMMPFYTVLRDAIANALHSSGYADKSDRMFDENIDALQKAGYKVDHYIDKQANLAMFKPENLQKYSLILVRTHGIHSDGVTSFLTGEEWGEEALKLRLNSGTDGSGISYIEVSSKWYDGQDMHLNDAFFMLSACQGLMGEDMANVLFRKGASCYVGYTDNQRSDLSYELCHTFCEEMAAGQELGDVVDYAKGKYEDWERIELLDFRKRDRSSSVYLFNPSPSDMNSMVSGNLAEVSWTIHPHMGEYDYHLFVDDKQCDDYLSLTDGDPTKAVFTPTDLSFFSWYVVSDYVKDGKVLSSVKSKVQEYKSDGHPVLKVSPDFLGFGEVDVSDSSTKPITINNPGDSPLHVHSFSQPDGFHLDLSKLRANGNVVEAGGSVDVDVTFIPTEEKHYQEVLTVNSDAVNGMYEIVLEGTGTSSPKTFAKVSPDNIEFGKIDAGTSTGTYIKVENQGSIPLMIKDINCPEGFSVKNFTPNTLEIAPNKNQYLNVLFSPSRGGSFGGNLELLANVYGGRLTVSVKGTGISSDMAKPLIKVSPKDIRFKDTVIGKYDEQILTVTNTGTADLHISSVNTPECFYVSPVSMNIKPGESKDFLVKFAPNAEGSCSGRISFNSDADNDDCEVSVSGKGLKGTSGPAVIKLSRASVEFIDVPVGKTGTEILGITNTGDMTLHVKSITCPDGFTTNLYTQVPLDPGSSIYVEIRFSPTELKTYGGILTVDSDAENGPQVVKLLGKVTSKPVPAISVSPASLDFGEKYTGEVTEKPVTITNTGNELLEITDVSCTDGYSVNWTSRKLEEGTSEILMVTFHPTEVKPYSGSIIIKSNASNGTVVVNSMGVGLKNNDPGSAAEALDLGLSVKWATWNLGASSPEESGDYYAWGETSYKNSYSWDSYQYSNSSGSSFNQYCLDPKYGTVDGKSMLDHKDDAAYKLWGQGWRIPTQDEINELLDKCTWTWSTSKKGYTVTSKVNGKSIFIPAAGYATQDNKVEKTGAEAHYWTSELYDTQYAVHLYFGNGSKEVRYATRYFGFTIRPVFGDWIVVVESVSLDRDSVTLSPGEHVTLRATINPSDASVKNLYWSSADDSVARVDNGVVTAVKPGTTTITVTTYNGKSATCQITVNKTGGLEGPEEGGNWNW